MKKVACVGDSITWGFTIIGRARHSYPAVLQTLLGEEFKVRNFGFNDASARIDSDTPYVSKVVFRNALNFEPDIVLLMLGSNDTKKCNWDPEEFRKGYLHIINSFTSVEPSPQVFLLTPPHLFDRYGLNMYGLSEKTMTEETIPAILGIASEKNLQVIDINSILDQKSLFTDGVHPGREGAAMIAQAAARAILP